MVDVFISYKREERAKARALAEALAHRDVKVWWDAQVLPGDRFTDEIEQVVLRAKAAVVLWCQRSVKSDFVRDEANLAKDRGILLPARLDATKPPLGFRGLHTEDLSAWDGSIDSPTLHRLVDTVVARVGGAAAAPSSEAETERNLHASDDDARLWAAVTGGDAVAPDEYQIYLKRFPKGLFADLARLRINQLDAPEKAQPPARKPNTAPASARPSGWASDKSAKVRLTLRGHTEQVNAVAFSPDGETILTGSTDATAKVWVVEL